MRDVLQEERLPARIAINAAVTLTFGVIGYYFFTDVPGLRAVTLWGCALLLTLDGLLLLLLGLTALIARHRSSTRKR